jgi:hypothetical protein
MKRTYTGLCLVVLTALLSAEVAAFKDTRPELLNIGPQELAQDNIAEQIEQLSGNAAIPTSDLARLGQQLGNWLTSYEAWARPLNEYMDTNFFRINRDGYTFEEFESGLEELEAQLLLEYDPYADLFAMLEELCSLYLSSDAATRSQVREMIADRNMADWVRFYAEQLAQNINGPEDVGMLRQALAAISIENCGIDYRDTLLSLANLYVKAEESGLDPKPHFADIADISTDAETLGGCESVAEMVREFESYEVLRERRSMGDPYCDR